MDSGFLIFLLAEKRTLRCGGNLCTLEGTGKWMKEDLAECRVETEKGIWMSRG